MEPTQNVAGFSNFHQVYQQANFETGEGVNKVLDYIKTHDSELNRNLRKSDKKDELKAELSATKDHLIQKAEGDDSIRDALLKLDCLHLFVSAKEKIDLASTIPDLKELDLHDSDLNDQLLATVVEKFPQLEKLNLRKCDRVSEIGFNVLENLVPLRSLLLSQCKNVTNETLKHLPPQLEELSLRRCKAVSLQGITYMTSREQSEESKMRILVIRGCNITDECLPLIATLPNLVELDLHRCPEISDAGLAMLANCKNITQLNVRECKKVTKDGLEAIKDLPLNRINITGCPSLKNEDAIAIFGQNIKVINKPPKPTKTV